MKRKKSLLFLMALMMCLLLLGCGKTEEPKETSEPVSEEAKDEAKPSTDEDTVADNSGEDEFYAKAAALFDDAVNKAEAQLLYYGAIPEKEISEEERKRICNATMITDGKDNYKDADVYYCSFVLKVPYDLYVVDDRTMAVTYQPNVLNGHVPYPGYYLATDEGEKNVYVVYSFLTFSPLEEIKLKACQTWLDKEDKRDIAISQEELFELPESITKNMIFDEETDTVLLVKDDYKIEPKSWHNYETDRSGYNTEVPICVNVLKGSYVNVDKFRYVANDGVDELPQVILKPLEVDGSNGQELGYGNLNLLLKYGFEEGMDDTLTDRNFVSYFAENYHLEYEGSDFKMVIE